MPKHNVGRLSAHSRSSILFTSALIIAAALGCMGGSGKTCVGEIDVAGTKYSGSDKNAENAKRNTCSKYCIEGDPEMDAMFNIWLDSLPAKERGRVRKGAKGKWDALYKNDRITKYVDTCTKKCVSEGNVTVKCDN